MSLAAAQHAVAATTLWHYRVLAGWVPAPGVQLLRLLAAGFEIANVELLLRRLRAADEWAPAYQLGSLATTWPRLQHADSTGVLREVLSRSAWGDPGEGSPWAIGVGMRVAWAHRAVDVLPARWVLGATALLVARERFAARRALAPVTQIVTTGLLGSSATSAGSLAGFVAALPRDAAWPLGGITDATELWTAEASWWRAVEGDAFADLRGGRMDMSTLRGAAMVLGVDAWRVRAALEVAARGGAGREVFNAVA
jgi:hypothetical protein